jgi:hypothetical protein
MASIANLVRRVIWAALFVSACAKHQPVNTGPMMSPLALVPLPDSMPRPQGEWMYVPCRPRYTTPPDKRVHVVALDGKLRGLVVDGETKAPLIGAEVVLDSSSARLVGTNPLGLFVFTNVSAGTHAIRIRAIGYRPVLDIVVVDPEGTAHLTYEMRIDVYEGVCLEFVPARKPK